MQQIPTNASVLRCPCWALIALAAVVLAGASDAWAQDAAVVDRVTLDLPDHDPGWEVGHSDSSGGSYIVEYVRKGESVEDWSELVTVLFTATPSTPQTFAQSMDFLRHELGKNCRSFEWSETHRTDSELVVDWRHRGCAAPAQHVVARFFLSDGGLYSLQYARKTPTALEEETISLWQGVFSRVSTSPPGRGPSKVNLPIAGGETIEIEVLDGMPLPAQDERARIDVAGWTRVEGELGQVEIADALVVSFQGNAIPTWIRVEDVTSDPVVLVLDDSNPTVKGGLWRAAVRRMQAEEAAELSRPGDEANVLPFHHRLRGWFPDDLAPGPYPLRRGQRASPPRRLRITRPKQARVKTSKRKSLATGAATLDHAVYDSNCLLIVGSAVSGWPSDLDDGL